MDSNQNVWHKWALIPLWIVHLCILIPPQFSLLVRLLADPTFDRIWLWLLYNFGMPLCLFLECREIALFRAERLKPRSYLRSTAFKALYFTWDLANASLLFSLHGQYLVRLVLEVLTFYLGFAYALYVWFRQRRYKRDSRASDANDQFRALMAPPRLNPADDIKGNVPMIIMLTLWIKRDPRWIQKLPWQLKMPLSPLLWTLRYAFCCIPIILLFPFTGRLPGEPKSYSNNGTSTSMNDWSYPKPSLTPQDPFSDEDTQSHIASTFIHDEEAAVDTVSLQRMEEDLGCGRNRESTGNQMFQPSPSRLLGPRYLCFVADGQMSSNNYTTQRVENWMANNQTQNEPDYIFVSYTRQQFYSQIYNDPTVTSKDLIRYGAAADRDKAILLGFAIKAATDAGVPAFWVDFECVQPEDESDGESDMEDVYRICDIVRASHSLVIISGPQLDSMLERNTNSHTTRTDWLLDWGKRLWTLPEALLCPSEHRISIYALGSDEPEKVAKRNLPSRLWDDAGTIRQLIDHYEASLQLTQLELISIALECLQRRQTVERNAGDVAYALMGLLRLRPRVNKSDTSFQAFARLSLANDSDMILERLISLRNPKATASWHDMQDTWDLKLWQIDPDFQICGIGPQNTVIIGGAAGTRIDWISLKMVDITGTVSLYTSRWRYARNLSGLVVGYLLGYLVLVFLVFPALNYTSGNSYSSVGPRLGKVMIWPAIIWGVCALPVPWVLSTLFKGQITSAQGRVFGIAGVPDCDRVEQHVFGEAHGRLRWNTDGCVTEQEEDQEEQDQRFVFTLVDTVSMSLTTFRSNKPPTMLFVGGRERGLLRVLLCSYDIDRRSFIKETVTRLEGVISTRFPKLDRFRFSVQRTEGTYQQNVEEMNENIFHDDDAIELPDIPEFISLD